MTQPFPPLIVTIPIELAPGDEKDFLAPPTAVIVHCPKRTEPLPICVDAHLISYKVVSVAELVVSVPSLIFSVVLSAAALLIEAISIGTITVNAWENITVWVYCIQIAQNLVWNCYQNHEQRPIHCVSSLFRFLPFTIVHVHLFRLTASCNWINLSFKRRVL